jgi:hypothetical protein
MHEGINTVFSTMIYATRKNQVASFIDKKKKKKTPLFKCSKSKKFGKQLITLLNLKPRHSKCQRHKFLSLIYSYRSLASLRPRLSVRERERERERAMKYPSWHLSSTCLGRFNKRIENYKKN